MSDFRYRKRQRHLAEHISTFVNILGADANIRLVLSQMDNEAWNETTTAWFSKGILYYEERKESKGPEVVEVEYRRITVSPELYCYEPLYDRNNIGYLMTIPLDEDIINGDIIKGIADTFIEVGFDFTYQYRCE